MLMAGQMDLADLSLYLLHANLVVEVCLAFSVVLQTQGAEPAGRCWTARSPSHRSRRPPQPQPQVGRALSL
jgi:hypothetical protein